MTHRIVNPDALVKPVGFAHAVVARGTTVHLGGQTALSRDGEIVGRTLTEQFDVASDNLLQALTAAGAQPDHLVSLLIFVTDVPAYRAARRELGAAWRQRFGRHYPAMALLGVQELYDPGALVELVGTAVIP